MTLCHSWCMWTVEHPQGSGTRPASQCWTHSPALSGSAQVHVPQSEGCCWDTLERSLDLLGLFQNGPAFWRPVVGAMLPIATQWSACYSSLSGEACWSECVCCCGQEPQSQELRARQGSWGGPASQDPSTHGPSVPLPTHSTIPITF